MYSILAKFHQRPHRPGRPPRGPPLFPPLGGTVRVCPCCPPLCGLLPRPPRSWPRGFALPRWLAGSWPDSRSGGGTGFGGGGGAGCAGLVTWGAMDLTGITDSSLARLLAGSAVSPPMTYAIVFLAATLAALEVRCTPSPAQMLVPSTVVSSCVLDSSGPKNSNMLRILAFCCPFACCGGLRQKLFGSR